MTFYTTEEMVKYFSGKPHKNVEFRNVQDKNIEVFLCRDGSIGKGEIGDGAVYKFNPEEYKNELWIMSLNPYK